MATWQFWTLFTVLVMILLTAIALLTAVKDLWTKLHYVQEAINRKEGMDYREDLERLGGALARVRDAILAQTPDYDPD